MRRELLGLGASLREWLAGPRLALARHGSLAAAPRPFGAPVRLRLISLRKPPSPAPDRTARSLRVGQPVTTYMTRRLGLQPYEPVYRRMREFTLARTADTADELWFLEHDPVFTQGQAGKPEHVLAPGAIPVVQSDRGGQVTYHGPGQLMGYVLVDLQRLGYGIRSLVTRLEQATADCLAGYGIEAAGRRDAPGVYVGGRKICSLGLRVRKGCTYHGLALNVAMDLEPFGRINPCGFKGLAMAQVSELGGPADLATVARDLEPHLARRLWLNG